MRQRTLAAIALSVLLTGALSTGCLMAPETLVQSESAQVAPGAYWVDTSTGVLAYYVTPTYRGADDDGWIEIDYVGENWYRGPGLYRVDEYGVWTLDTLLAGITLDELLQLVDTAPPPAF